MNNAPVLGLISLAEGICRVQDPAEHHDLAKEQPDLMANITARWQAAQARAPYFQTNVRTPRF